jgi:hypothetical protein
MSITNRELAVAIWIVVFLAWALTREDIRRSFGNVLRVLFRRVIALSLILIAVYIYAETRILAFVGVWEESNVKDTIIWGVTVAVVMFINVTKIADDDQFYRKAALDSFKASVILSFLVNLYTFSLPVELLLVPLSVLLVGVQAVAQSKEEYKSVQVLVSNVLVVVGAAMLLNAGYDIYSNFGHFAQLQTAKDFAVPPALSLLFLPLIYFFSVLLKYEGLFARLRFYVSDDKLSSYLKRRLVWTYGVNIWRLNRWAAALPTFNLRSKEDVLESLREREYSTATEPPVGFRSYEWGSAPSESMKKYHGPNKDGLSMYVPATDTIPALFDIPVAEEAYSFSQDKFYSASAWLNGTENFERMRLALPRAYGPPSFCNDELYLWKWKWPMSQVEIHLFFEKKFSRTTVTFLNNAI